MNLKAGYPFSLIRNGIPFDYPKLEKNTHTEVLVIGGGITGALVAHRLMEEGLSCMIIDQRSIGLGSTCASTSLLQYEIDEPLHRLCEKMGEKSAVRAYKLCAGSIHRLARVAEQAGFPVFRYKKSLQLAARKKDIAALEKEFRLRRKHGFDLEFIPGSLLKKDFGLLASAALLTGLAADTDSYLFTHHLLQYLLPRGLRVYDRTKALSVEAGKKNFLVRSGLNHQIRCRFIVYANGYEAARQIPKGLLRLQSTYVTISEAISDPFPFWKEDALLWTTGHPYLYIRSTPDARIMVGGRDEALLSPRRRDQLIPLKAKQLSRDFKRIFPGRSFDPEFSWAGIFGSTPDGLPYIGTLAGRPRCYYALGFGGNGITFGQVAADILSDLLRGKSNQDAALFAFDRK